MAEAVPGEGVNAPLYAFNRGLIDKRGLARVDLQRSALSAEIQTNFIPHDLGAMSLRPGWKYLGTSKSNARAYTVPFVFSTDDTALLELTDSVLRVWDGDSLVSRNSVSTAFTNGAFTTDLTGWTDDDDSGATSAWATGGYMGLTGTASAAAKRYQELTVAGGDQSVAHGLTVVVQRGLVTLRVGTTAGDDDLFDAVTLGRGTHSLVFTPTGASAFVQLEANTEYESQVDSVAIESSGTLELATPWTLSDLPSLRYEQSGNVVYVGGLGIAPRKLVRRSNNSWSIARFYVDDGPFEAQNTTGVTITPSATRGDITLTASAPLFTSSHVDGLFRITSTQQLVEGSGSAVDATSDYIEVTGSGSTRAFTRTLAGSWSATVVLERALASPDSWATVATFTGNTSASYNDGLDNQVAYYRWRISAYTSDTVDFTLDYPNGSINGTARIVSVASATSASAIVHVPLGGTTATRLWSEGSWSGVYGYPGVPLVYEGRLWWFGKGAAWGSLSDAFESHDPDVEGDSGAIKRIIGFGAVDRINWAVPLQRLMTGSDSAEISVRSSGDLEVITQENINIKASSTQGSADIQAQQLDTGAIFVQRSARRVFELGYKFEPNDYAGTDLTQHAPQVGRPGLERLAVQRQPDTRLHLVRSDGKVAVCLYNRAEEIIAWVLVETDGVIEDVTVLPGANEDAVYYWVKRTIDGNTVRYLERWALEDDSVDIWTTLYQGDSTTTITGLEYVDDTLVTVRDSDGDIIENLTVTDGAITLSTAATYAHITPALAKLADSYLVYSGAATTTITGLDHLEGETVVVWGDGADQGTFTVTSGQITGLGESVENAVVGLAYTAKFRSTKLAYADKLGTALGQVKKVADFSLLLVDTHHDGVQVGRDFDNLFDIPQNDRADTVPDHTVYESKDLEMTGFAGAYDTDSRFCIQAAAPRPCTVAAAIIGLETHDL